MLQPIRGLLRSSAFAAVVALSAVAGSAHAVVYVGKWDPLFNASFSGLVGPTVGWKGNVTVDVADGCLVAGTTPTPGSGDCTSAAVTAAALTFYDTNPSSVLGTITTWNPFPSIAQLSIDGGGDVNGVDLTGPIGGFTSIFSPYFFSVALDLTFVEPTLVLTLTDCGGGVEFCETGSTFASGSPTDIAYQPQNFTWTLASSVPEPGSLALIGAALAGLGWSRRRRD